MNKSIAIVGGGGFIGSNLTNFFLEKGYFVSVLSRSIDPKRFSKSNLTRFILDVNDTERIIKSIHDCENVIWLVSTSVPSVHQASLVDDYKSDVQSLVRFLEASKRLPNLKRFVFMSSGGTIYGDPTNQQPICEDLEKDPISIYGLSKILSEKYVKFITRESGFQSFILRPSNVYGTYQNLLKPQGIIGFAFKSILNNSYLDLYNGGMVVRDFIYVSDLAEAVYRCLESDVMCSRTSIYNVGSEQGYTIREIVDKVGEISGTKVLTNDKLARSFDCNYNVLNISRIKTELNWQPRVKLEEGLTCVWEWIKTGYNGK